MTRCSDLCLLLALALPGHLRAETLVADAFGLFDPANDTVGRSDWAGLQGGSTFVAPDAPDRILIYAGPKTLAAGTDPGQVAAILVDRNGNIVKDGIPVQLVIGDQKVLVQSRDGLASTLFQPHPVAGSVAIGAAAEDRQSARAMVTVVADFSSVTPKLEGPLPEARAETVFDIPSTPLIDRFGNPLADGTGATFLLSHADGSYSLAFTMTLQDRATASFIVRDFTGASTAQLFIGKGTSPPESLSVAAPKAVSLPEIVIERLTDISALRLTLGPFLTSDGYVLSDGAQVKFAARLTDGQDISDEAWLLDGRVSLLLPLASPASVAAISIQSPLGKMDLTSAWQAAAAALPPDEGQTP